MGLQDVIEFSQDLPGQTLLAAAKAYVDHPENRRQQPRRSATLACFVTPIDEHENPLGKPLPGVTIDISPNGIGILISQAIRPQRTHIAIQRKNNVPLELIAEVLACEETQNVFRLGVKLVRKLDS